MKRKIWVTLALVVLAVLLCCGAASAASSGTCGENVSWTLDDAGTLTISGTGPMADYDEDSPFYSDTNIKNVVIEEGVTSIGNEAFYKCSAMTNVTIPNSVTSIGEYAFYDCLRLTSVTIPNSVTSIGRGVFRMCKSLTNVTIPNGVTSIGTDAFDYCSGLTSLTIPDSVTTIGPGAFSFCTGLTTVTIPSSVTSTKYGSFQYCSNLKTAIILNENITITESSFAGTASGFTLWGYAGSTTESYANRYSYNFQEITSGTCGENLTWDYADNTLIISGTGAMTDFPTSSNVPWSTYRASIQSVVLDSGVSSIGANAFSRCLQLNQISLPKSVTQIGDRAFLLCSALYDVTIYQPYADFGNDVFLNCATGLVIRGYTGSTTQTYAAANSIQFIPINTPTFYLPANLTTIEADAFQGISAEAVLIPATVTQIIGDPFAGSKVVFIYGSSDLVKTFASLHDYIFIQVSE